jgi:hypothetical protein
MGKSKKGLNNKVVTVYNPNGDDEFDVYVTYTFFNEEEDMDDSFGDSPYISREDVDIKHFESNDDEDLPEWVNEDLIYDALIEELEEDALWEDEDDDYEDEDDDFDDDQDENW